MSTITINGIDGSELFGFLSGLGVLRILSVPFPATALSWTREGEHWSPELTTPAPITSVDHIATILADALCELKRDAPDTITLGGTFINFTRKEFTSALHSAVIRWTEAVLDTENPDTHHLSHVIAPAALSAMGSEALVEGEEQTILRTPLSLSNNQGGQNLLRDFRSLAGLSGFDQINDSLRGSPTQCKVHSLNLHPQDYRPGAYRWSHSVDDKPTCDPVTNALSYVGLSFFPVMPAPGLAVPGVTLKHKGWELTWPLWKPPLEADRVAALLLQEEWYMNTGDTGVKEVRRTGTVRGGKTNSLTFVTPSWRVR